MTKIKIAGISGSLRKESYNTKVLNYIRSHIKDDVEFNILDISELPLYNDDLEVNVPQSVIAFRESIKNSNGIIFSTPEYNFSTSGVLKNAIDWGSRPLGQNAWDLKTAAIISSSPGDFGGVRALIQLRQMLTPLNLLVMPKPEVIIPNVNKKFSNQGELIDEETIIRINKLLDNFYNWTITLNNYKTI